MRHADPASPFGWRRFFVLHDKLHPLWRVGLYLPMALFGSAAIQIPIGVAYAVVLIARGVDPVAMASQLAAGDLPPVLHTALTIADLAWVLGVTWVFRRWLDKAPLRSLGFSLATFWREVVVGLAIGLGSMVIVLAVHLLFGWGQMSLAAGGWAALGTLAVSAVVLLPAAASEEIIFRGYVLQTLESWRGWWLALIAASVLFGLAHFQNPSFGILAMVNIGLAGVALAFAYRLTRRLWLAIAYHYMWNFAQGPLFGFRVSGLKFGSPVETVVAGPALWTGGAFGPEAGLVVTLLLVFTVLLLWFWMKHGKARW